MEWKLRWQKEETKEETYDERRRGKENVESCIERERKKNDDKEEQWKTELVMRDVKNVETKEERIKLLTNIKRCVGGIIFFQTRLDICKGEKRENNECVKECVWVCVWVCNNIMTLNFCLIRSRLMLTRHFCSEIQFQKSRFESEHFFLFLPIDCTSRFHQKITWGKN